MKKQNVNNVVTDVAVGDLLSEIVALREEIKVKQEVLRAMELQVAKHMEAQNASILKTGDYHVKLEPNYRYEYNFDELLKLKDYVASDEFESAVQVTYKANKTRLNQLAKYGGKVAEIINNSTTKVELPPKLEINPIKSQKDEGD
jgi:hypothetical protein